MNRFLASLTLIFILASCSTLQIWRRGNTDPAFTKEGFDSSSKPKLVIDARNLIDREQIDAANIPVLFVIGTDERLHPIGRE